MSLHPLSGSVAGRGAIVLCTLLAVISPAAAQEDAAEPLAEALALLERGDGSAAIERLEQLRQAGQADEVALAVLGGLYTAAGLHSQALEILTPLADAGDADTAVLYNAGRSALAIGRLREAARWLERLNDLEPESLARRELGLLRARQGREEEALALLQPWVEQDPDDLQVRAVAAVAAINLKRTSEADWLVEGLPAERPATALLRGRLALIKGEPRRAVEILQPALGSGPPSVQRDVRRNLAAAHLLLGAAGDAVSVLEGRVANDPGLTLQLAQAYHQDGQTDKAVSALEPLVTQIMGTRQGSPLAATILLEQSRFLVGIARATEALPYLERLVEQSPNDATSLQLLAQALAAAGRRDEAMSVLERHRQLTEGAKQGDSPPR